MKLVFKLTDESAESIVGNTNFKEHYPNIHANMAWDTLKPIIRQVTRKYIVPFIGEALYEDIASEFEDDNALTPEQEKFLELLQDAIAWYTAYDLIPTGAISIADAGVGEASGDKQTPARQFAMNKALWKIIVRADETLDELLSFLEKQVEAEVDYFDLWKNDASFSKNTSAFFRRTDEFNEIINIHDSRRTFVALLPNIRRSEKTKLKELICKPMYDELTGQFSGKTLSEANGKLLPFVREFIAHHALALAVPHLAVLIENDGIKVTSASDSMESKGNVLSTFGKESVDRLIQRAQDDARKAEKELIGFLYANADDYATWKGSPCYQDPEVEIEETDPDDITGGVLI